LAVKLAEHIVRRTIEEYPDTIDIIIEETIAYLIGSEKVILKVSDDDYKNIQAKYDKWLSAANSPTDFRIETDVRLKQGDCLIETEGGIIDSIVENRLASIAEQLVKASPTMKGEPETDTDDIQELLDKMQAEVEGIEPVNEPSYDTGELPSNGYDFAEGSIGEEVDEPANHSGPKSDISDIASDSPAQQENSDTTPESQEMPTDEMTVEDAVSGDDMSTSGNKQESGEIGGGDEISETAETEQHMTESGDASDNLPENTSADAVRESHEDTGEPPPSTGAKEMEPPENTVSEPQEPVGAEPSETTDTTEQADISDTENEGVSDFVFDELEGEVVGGGSEDDNTSSGQTEDATGAISYDSGRDAAGKKTRFTQDDIEYLMKDLGLNN
jgi:hypothetical protein